MAAPCFLVLVVLAATASSSRSAIANGSCFPAERTALLAFKAGITSDPQNLLISWQQGHHDCCRWGGVTCSSRTGHVIKLDLRNRSPTADESLTYLNLSYVGFHGLVPPQLGNLSNLVLLDIHNDITYKSLYSKDISWLARLHSLEHLNMAAINLSGVVDWALPVDALPNLVVLILRSCGINMINAPSTLVQHNLTVLEELDLSYNSLNIPATSGWFWDVTSLKSLSLMSCGLSGIFPDELGNLTLLETFDISFNNIKGMIPGTMQNMCDLRSLDLSGNNIGGDITNLIDKIPNCSWKNLHELSLMSTNITGTTLQYLAKLTSLSILDVSNNQLSCSVPVEIGILTNLTELYLGLNNLSGVISEDLFVGLVNLKTIDLSYTNLELITDSHWVPGFNLDYAWFTSCHLGPEFPNWLRWQKSIIHLDISNTSLVGRIPGWFWTSFSDARVLEISLNQLSGELPLNLEFMSVLAISMHSNLLTGLIPRLPRKIELLDISRNSLNGFASNFRAPGLQVAIMFSNSITGTIPTSICQMRNLRVLDLSNNMLSGELPDCGVKELKQRNPYIDNSSRVNSMSSFSLQITTILLSNNSLSSGFPLVMQQCQNLMFLDLSRNKFTGELPGWITMTSLVILLLRSNNFSGNIPAELMELPAARILDLSNNNFSGVIPNYLENLKALIDGSGDDYVNPFGEWYNENYFPYDMGMSDDSFSVVIKGQVLQYRQNTLYLMSIDLSSNHLTGEIPMQLGSLIGLINLNLSSNLLTGNIPYQIGNLRSLESFDLSKNALEGGIPQCLSNLTYLSYLNLSFNNLSGKIPSGHQLDVLNTDDPASMYIGNPGLCGHPVPRQCLGLPADPLANCDSAIWSGGVLSQMDFLLGSIVGFVAGTWMVFCGLLFMKRWRYAYFGLFDQLYDWLYVISVTWQKWFKNDTGKK
ncbi:receptor-like protein EIX1 [Lolium rigidum]|uniref:receptor-like protein EIX1 n=1 Tax=Lolium rigidum TaxID=89674 RepID=UPI001F5C323B|nr:receptor-like protein EIX1 [Lolium rigidum]